MRINQQAGQENCNQSVLVNEWVDLPTAAPTPESSPIYEITHSKWINLTASQQQFIFKKQHILLRDCPVKSYRFDLPSFRELLGNPDTWRTMHGVWSVLIHLESATHST